MKTHKTTTNPAVVAFKRGDVAEIRSACRKIKATFNPFRRTSKPTKK